MHTTKQHTIMKSITLHLLPGLAGVIVYILIAPILMQLGYPAMFSILVAATLVILPIELGYIMRQAKLANDSISLKNIILYRTPLPKWQYIVVPLGLVIWGFLATGITPLLDNAVAKAWFSWLPEWFVIFDISQLRQYSRSALITTFVLGLYVMG